MFKAGFTLIELLITILIVGILFSLSIPALNLFCGNYGLGQSAQMVAGEIRALQARAHTQHQKLSLDISRLLPNHIVVVQNHPIAFAASGFPVPGCSGTLILQNRFGHSKKIVISSLGRVRVE